MTVSLAEATAAARRITEDAFSNDPSTRWRQFNADARLLAGFVLAGDTERLRTALDEVECYAVDWTQGTDANVEAVKEIARAALAEGSP